MFSLKELVIVLPIVCAYFSLKSAATSATLFGSFEANREHVPSINLTEFWDLIAAEETTVLLAVRPNSFVKAVFQEVANAYSALENLLRKRNKNHCWRTCCAYLCIRRKKGMSVEL